MLGTGVPNHTVLLFRKLIPRTGTENDMSIPTNCSFMERPCETIWQCHPTVLCQTLANTCGCFNGSERCPKIPKEGGSSHTFVKTLSLHLCGSLKISAPLLLCGKTERSDLSHLPQSTGSKGILIVRREVISSRFREANRFFRSQSAGLPESAGTLLNLFGRSRV